jgi:cysteinyl-tRNA synthetase
MYVCGPTVYDDPHLGHLRSAFAFEIIPRVLKLEFDPPADPQNPNRKSNVTFVRNVTDIDDKIIQRAADRGASWETIAKTYYEAYRRDTDRLGVEPPTVEPRATENLEGMFAIIRDLEKSGMAYASAGSVYFAVRKFAAYGQLSHQKVDEMLANWRGEPGDGKSDGLDFALWKRSKEGEPSWESPWGPGRPGWHIECSAMSARFCGKEFDIHGGGKDLVFPHHENERAQSIAAFGGRFARTWIHHGLVTIDGHKMSKSSSNFLTLNAFLEKCPGGIDILKLFFLQSHYTQDVDFTWEKMSALHEAYRSLADFIEKAGAQRPQGAYGDDSGAFFGALKNDFNTPEAVANLFILLKTGNIALAAGRAGEARACANAIWSRGHFLGLFESLQTGVAVPELDRILEIRKRARETKKYAAADQIRTDLEKLNLKVEDHKSGSRIVGLADADLLKLRSELRDIAVRAEGFLK